MSRNYRARYHCESATARQGFTFPRRYAQIASNFVISQGSFMQIDVIAKPAESAAVSIVFASEGKKLVGLGAVFGKALQKAMATPAFAGKRGQIVDVLGSKDGRRIVIVGIGNPRELSAIRARKIGGKIAAHLMRAREPKAQVLGGGQFGKLEEAVFLGNIALGARLRAYRFGKYVTQPKPGEPGVLEALSL